MLELFGESQFLFEPLSLFQPESNWPGFYPQTKVYIDFGNLNID